MVKFKTGEIKMRVIYITQNYKIWNIKIINLTRQLDTLVSGKKSIIQMVIHREQNIKVEKATKNTFRSIQIIIRELSEEMTQKGNQRGHNIR